MGTDYRLILPNKKVVYETYKGRGYALTKFAVKRPVPSIFGAFPEDYLVWRFEKTFSGQAYVDTLDIGLDEEESPYCAAVAVTNALSDPDHVLVTDERDWDIYRYPTEPFDIERARERAKLDKPYPYFQDGWTLYPSVTLPNFVTTD